MKEGRGSVRRVRWRVASRRVSWSFRRGVVVASGGWADVVVDGVGAPLPLVGGTVPSLPLVVC